MTLAGTWDVDIRTPVGTQHVTLHITREGNAWQGWAEGSAERVDLRDLTVADDHATWSQSITRPLRLNLQFAVDVDGDLLAGVSKAGRLPSSAVRGRRVS